MKLEFLVVATLMIFLLQIHSRELITKDQKQFLGLSHNVHFFMQGYSNTKRWSSEARASVEDSSSSSSSQLAAAVPSSSSQDSGSRENYSATTNEDGGSVGAGALQLLVGEDAAVFDPSNQKTSSWLLFTLILGVSLTALYVLWIDPNTGYGRAFIDAVSSVSSSHEVNSIPSSLLQ